MRASITAISNRSDRGFFPYIWITLSLLLVFIFLRRLTPQLVGDGSEYYALFFAWKETLRPWMSAISFNAYQQLFLAHDISGFLPADFLANRFPALRLGDTADFNHFWLYSFLAFFIGKVCELFGLSLHPHVAFLGLHLLLLNLTAIVAYHLYGLRGFATFILITLLSPMLWFFDKVHSELFTYCLTLIGVMLVFSNRYLLAAFCLAIASTQNPSFALIALVPFLYRFALQKTEKITIFELCLVIGTALAVLAHPTYYFFRYGVITPQLLAGGATLGGNLSTFYIWILDPDLGLLPNWPLGVILTLAAVLIRKFAPPEIGSRGNWAFYVFVAIFFLVNFYAHSSTTNLNSGATPGVARYSLWYLPAWFPIVYYVVRRFPKQKFAELIFLLVIALTGIISISKNNPKLPQDYWTPTWLSNTIQTKLPFLYTPPAEVFAERYSGFGESIHQMHPLGVLGPDCRKLLLFSGQGRDMVTTPNHCQIDNKKMQALAKSLVKSDNGEHFVRLSDADYNTIQPELVPGSYSIGTAGTGNFFLKSGWNDLESWGVWSKNKVAVLSFPCNKLQFYSTRPTLDLVLGLQGFGNQQINITQDGTSLFQGKVEALVDVSVQVQVSECRERTIDLDINTANPVSPASLGQSTDERKIGVGLSKITVMP